MDCLISTYDLTNETALNDSIVLEYLGDLVTGDLVKVRLRYENVSFNLTLAGSISIVAEKEGLEAGEVVNLQYIIPISWYVRDIISDLTTIFNLAWETDVLNKKVYAYPKDDYTIRYRANSTGAISLTTFDGFFTGSNKYDLNTRDIEGSEFEILDGRTVS